MLIHKLSARSQRPFLKVNCAAMPLDLLESELFGFEQGAFTGAVKSKPGKFEICNNGTILLDEIGEMRALYRPSCSRFFRTAAFSRWEAVHDQGGCPRDCRNQHRHQDGYRAKDIS